MTLKTCNQCKEAKYLTEFFKDKNNKTDGHYSICKACKQSNSLKWRESNKDRYNKIARDWRANNKDEVKDFDLKRCYGISLQDYNTMLSNQHGVCKICEKPQKGVRPLVVDHCHESGVVRGLLCYGCNRLIVVLDNHPMYIKAIEYLKKSNK